MEKNAHAPCKRGMGRGRSVGGISGLRSCCRPVSWGLGPGQKVGGCKYQTSVSVCLSVMCLSLFCTPYGVRSTWGGYGAQFTATRSPDCVLRVLSFNNNKYSTVPSVACKFLFLYHPTRSLLHVPVQVVGVRNSRAGG